MEEAVKLARRKGLRALCADIYEWEPDELWSVIYIDGVLGHLYDQHQGLVPVLERIRSWLEPRRDSQSCLASLVASNDAPQNGESVEAAAGVKGFRWLSAEYMRAQALLAGFKAVSTQEYRYQRPISGGRTRAVITAYVAR
jgi:hypothetical protein